MKANLNMRWNWTYGVYCRI